MPVVYEVHIRTAGNSGGTCWQTDALHVFEAHWGQPSKVWKLLDHRKDSFIFPFQMQP